MLNRDFAWKKGDRYSTLLVDLEGVQVNMLPDREAATVLLVAHPRREVKLISQDRAGLRWGPGAVAHAPGSRRSPCPGPTCTDAIKGTLARRSESLPEVEAEGASRIPVSQPSSTASRLPEGDSTDGRASRSCRRDQEPAAARHCEPLPSSVGRSIAPIAWSNMSRSCAVSSGAEAGSGRSPAHMSVGSWSIAPGDDRDLPGARSHRQSTR